MDKTYSALFKMIENIIDNQLSSIGYDKEGLITSKLSNDKYVVVLDNEKYQVKNGTEIEFVPGDKCLVRYVNGSDKNKIIIAKVTASNNHQTIQQLVRELIADIEDLTIDGDGYAKKILELSEKIQDNAELISELTENKVDVVDIIDHLNSNEAKAPLSANQGRVLKEYIDEINEKLNNIDFDITKEDIGLGNVDNTADANKNVLTATRLTIPRNINGTAFDGSQDIITEKWGQERTISFTGDVTGNTSTDGSGDISVGLTLADGVKIRYYSSTAEFPAVGNKQTLYIVTENNEMYRWDDDNLKYYKISGNMDVDIIICGDSTEESTSEMNYIMCGDSLK